MAALLTFLHRWLGVGLALFFAMWFFSGVVMIYVPFPSLSQEERLASLAAIDTKAIAVSPAAAIERCGGDSVSGIRIVQLLASPAYVCHREGQPVTVFHAATGARVRQLEQQHASQIVQRLGRGPVALVETLELDQWTVHERFGALRPLHRVELADDAGTHLYVSSRTGELVQRTTRSQRFWNYLGAVAHWIYPTLLRKNWALWDALVWWLSGLGVVCATVGMYLGISRSVRLRRTGDARLSAFRGWMRWHHVLGLFAGLAVVSWIVSGWLSMDHGRLFSESTPTAAQVLAVRGGTLADVAAKVSIEQLARHEAARELSLHAFGGRPIVVARNLQGVIDTAELEPTQAAEVVGAAMHGGKIEGHSIVPDRDTYTHLREGRLPPGTIRVELADANESWVHVDRHAGEILSVLDSSRRLYRWLFNGLHSLDFPGLADRRPLWDATMLALLAAGFVASSTGVVIGLKRLLKTVSR